MAGPGARTRGEAGRYVPGRLASEIQALFAEARRRRRRRRLIAGLISLALAVAVTGAWIARPGDRGRLAHPRGHAMAATSSASFPLPAAHVAWVDYNGRLHVGDVATLAQHVVGTVPAWGGASWLVQASGRIYGADSPVIREFDPATGKVRRIARGDGIFPSADGRRVFIEHTDRTLIELRANGHRMVRRLKTPAGWFLSAGTGEVAGDGIVVSSGDGAGNRRPPAIGIWNPRGGHVTVLGTGYIVGMTTQRGVGHSLLAWARCWLGTCPLKITSIPSMRTVTVHSPLRYGIAQGAAFSPDGTRLAIFERTASINSYCCANNSLLAIVNTRTGAVHRVPAARLETQEDAGWILWLSGSRLVAGALLYSYAVDTRTHAARPFFFFPQKADGAEADHNIMDTPDINFSAVLLPPVAASRTGHLMRKIR